MLLPQNEIRKFYNNTLNNNIKYTLIYDENIVDTTVSLSVKVGSYFEPKEFNGLAHFLEHMLFLGSKKYPIENYFDSKLKSYGGFSNAYTGLFETVYYFNVLSNHTAEILDIFSRFFIDPIFDSNSVSREINAINSEHLKNVNHDAWILRQFLADTSKEYTPINKFFTGNLETLDKENLRDVMIDFYNKYYCSDNLCLAIISNIKVEKMNEILKKTFGMIPNIKSTPIRYLKKPYYNSGNIYHLIPVNTKKEIVYYWEIPLFYKYKHTKIWNIISDVINGEEITNIKYFLKNNNIIDNMSCQISDFGLFVVVISLKNEDNIIEKTKIVNRYLKFYLNTLMKMNWDNIYSYHIKKRQTLFKFLEKINDSDLVDLLSNNLHYYDIKYIYASSLVTKIDLSLLKKELSKLNFNNMNILLISKNKILKPYNINKFYNYKWINLQNKKLLFSDEKKFNFNIQNSNSYLNLDPKVDKDINIDNPVLLKNNIWYGGLSKFNQPKVYTVTIYSSNDFTKNILEYSKYNILLDVLNYYLSIYFNDIMQFGYYVYFTINTTYSVIKLNVGGYNYKFDLFLKNIFKYLSNILVQDHIIKNNIQLFNKFIENIKNLSPIQYLNLKIQKIIHQSKFDDTDYYKIYNLITVDDIKIVLQKFIKLNYSRTVFIYGNLRKESIPKILYNTKDLYENKKIITTLNSISFVHPNKNEKNNIIQLMYNFKSFDTKRNLILFFLVNIMDQPCYDYLRTKKQLGYIVSTSAMFDSKNYYFYIRVVSNKDKPFLKKNIENFIVLFYEKLKKINLNKWKLVCKKLLLEEKKSNLELFGKYFNEILSKKFMFDRNKRLANEIDNLTLNDLLKYYTEIKNKSFFVSVVKHQK